MTVSSTAILAVLTATLLRCVLCNEGSTFEGNEWNMIKEAILSDAFILRIDELLSKDPTAKKDEKALINSFIESFQLCQYNLETAAAKMEKIINIYDPNYRAEDDSFSDLDEEDLFMNEDIFENDSLDLLDLELKLHTRPSTFSKDAERIIRALNKACASLPSAIPNGNGRRTRSPEHFVQKLALSLTKWAGRWTNSIEHKLDAFITHCSEENECRHKLEKFIQIVAEAIRAKEKTFGPRTSEAVEELLQDIKQKRSPSMESLSSLQRAVLQMGSPFNEVEERSFKMAEGVSNSDIKTTFHYEETISANLGLLSNMFSLGSKFKSMQRKGQEIEVETKNVVRKVPPDFLSLALSSSLIQNHWGSIKHNLPKFLTLASGLSPSFLRVGGSAANFLTFDPSEGARTSWQKLMERAKSHLSIHPKWQTRVQPESNDLAINLNHPKHHTKNQFKINLKRRNTEDADDQMLGPSTECEPQLGLERPFQNFTMTGDDWKFLVELAQELNWTLVFDINQFRRDSDGNWDPTNAKFLFQDSETSKIPIIWQLGSEPNAYQHMFNWSVTPPQAAKDYEILRQALNEAGLQPEATNPLVVGPDVTRPAVLKSEKVDAVEVLEENSMKFLTEFLRERKEEIDAVTWHQYYISGNEASIDELLSAENLNQFPKEVNDVVSVTNEMTPGKPIWLTGTASSWSGGTPNLSDRVVGAFPWLDKLGSAAFGGVSRVFRQALYGGCNALLDNDLNPKPDYWISVVHKQLVGEGVLLPRVRQAPETIRIYAHCLNPKYQLYKKGAVVVFGINLSGTEEKFELVGKPFQESPKFVYTLMPPQGDLTSRNVWLNGKILTLSDDGSLPPLVPYPDMREGLEFIPWSMTFWVIPEADAEVC